MSTAVMTDTETKNPETGAAKTPTFLAEPIHLATERNHQNHQNCLVVKRIHPLTATTHPVTAADHPMVHPMAAAAVEMAAAVVEMAAAEEIWICTKELMQRNPTWVVSQTDAAGKKPGLVEHQTSNGQDWRHPTQSTFLNHLRCNQAAQKQLPVTQSAPKEHLSKKKQSDSKQEKNLMTHMPDLKLTSENTEWTQSLAETTQTR